MLSNEESDKMSEEEFVINAIKKLRKPPYKGIHSVFSGFNEAFRLYFGKDPVETVIRLSNEGKVVTRPAKGGAILYIPGEVKNGQSVDEIIKKITGSVKRKSERGYQPIVSSRVTSRSTMKRWVPGESEKMLPVRVEDIKSGYEFQIKITSSTPMRFKLIYIPKHYRRLFPGYKIPFTLETPMGNIEARVVSAPRDTPIGDPDAGAYIKPIQRGGLFPLFEKYDLRIGNGFRIKILEPYRKYKLEIVR